ncbi:MAG: hypothetical protein ACRYFB_06370 [Janthinobacterium lividum]
MLRVTLLVLLTIVTFDVTSASAFDRRDRERRRHERWERNHHRDHFDRMHDHGPRDHDYRNDGYPDHRGGY